MTPEVLTSVRVLLVAMGGGLVGRGEITEELVNAAVGFLMILLAWAWGIYARRSSSKEAQQVAGRVADDPDHAPTIVRAMDPAYNTKPE